MTVMENARGGRFTPAQEAAVYSPESVAISAGAGSGKTRVLAERILNLLRGGVEPGQIVAVTFTEAAAAELRERITRYVEVRAEEEGPAWQAALAGLPLMQVSTIHGLCGRVAREHPVESGAGLGFEVLDEVEARAWLDEHLAPVLAELPADTLLAVPGKIRTDVIRTLLDDPTSARDALEVAAEMAVGDPAERAQRAWQAVAGEWNGARAALQALQGPPADELEQIRRATLQAAKEAPVLGAGLLAVRAALQPHKGTIGKGWTKEEKAATHAALKTIKGLAARDDLLGEATEGARMHDRAVVALHEVFTHVLKRFGQLKAEQEVATFADLEAYADAALVHEPVRAYYAARWTHLLIDEAQDTNPVQWRILSALAGDGVNLTVVGDEKQSIYAFRRADVAVFREAQAEVQSRGGKVIPMATSFRTHAGLVAAVNVYFENLMRGPDETRPTAAKFEPLSAHRQEHPGGEDAPSVELHVIHGDDTASLRKAEATYLAGRIQALQLAAPPVYDREAEGLRPLRLSDVAMLFRARTDLKLYEDALSRAGLPFVVHGGRGLYDRPEVQDATNLLQAVADPTADVFLAAVLRGPHVQVTDDTLLELAQDREEGESLWASACRSDRPDVQKAVGLLLTLREASVTLSASQLLAEADGRTGALLVHAAQPDGARRVENVRRFQALLRRWAGEGVRDVVSVADHLTRLARLEAQEAEAISPHPDAVQLMTIHGSKGLEFPVVIVADALRQGGGPPPKVRFDARLGVALRLPHLDDDLPEWEALEGLSKERDLSEAERVAYVAFTRAADLLVLSVSGGDSGKAQERFATFVSHLPETGVERHYLTPEEVPPVAPLPLTLRGARPTLEVRSGPGVILPGSLAVTSLAKYLQCPRAFAYQYLEGRLPLASVWSERLQADERNPEKRAAGRQIGDAVHRAFEHSWTPLDMAERLAYLAPIDLKLVADCVRTFQGEAFASVNRRRYRREMPIQVPVGPVTFEGIVDAFDEEGRLVLDYKTDRTDHPEHHLPQLALYAHHLKAEQAALAYVRVGKLHVFSPEDLNTGMQQIGAAVERMTALDFAPTPSVVACRTCAFRGVCDAAVQGQAT
ncbi:UvrD-helicase domain-containing protein [Deinococcus hopiensis]|uniref:DNA 3'-5' helicase n=1 Tax=Deinococcus hopiensis KR-140 TaxID=695939 RepID=A0A1W1ULV3_9DEIO|nr:UvrD-helicase domain-containing protein [Deinococcus hopiensis]SMB82115.1 ATP-dependent exoDNAse (exonuclease V) beta subunit (contains helicase and exonuclease domains) [Deinococcus hopiensis KR-140]